jgi:predicted DNA-binding mobile mystery protein A
MNNLVRRQGRKTLDDKTAALKPISQFAAPSRGWIRAIRDALGMSHVDLAKRLGRISGTVDDLEISEVSGSIQLNTLRKTAEALGCTLVYALVPVTSLESFRLERARKIAEIHMRRVKHTMKLEGQAIEDDDELIARCIDQMKDREIWNG